MSIVKAFFENLDFSFEQDIVPKEIEFSNNEVLTKKIKNNIYFYKAPENVNTSFYLFDLFELNENDLFELKRYIWNEDKCEFYFYPDSKKSISLYYAKSNPQKDQEKSKIGSFEGQDNDEIEKIRKWNFETGAFWFSYKEFTKTITDNERIDKLLISRLIDLKKELLSALGNNNEKQVQSLIDRTLFIKFLEDNHIINSFFYGYYFDNEEITYKDLLAEKNVNKINLLFEKINEIFDNVLFETPHIEEQYILKASKFIYNAISGEVRGQLSLFDFQFNILPIEFISHIYEVFLEGKQADEGIYYTPPKLAQLIIDDTITKQGKVLDPACGSGMFLILAFRKMLENYKYSKNATIADKIEIRIKLLKENVFGIEKQYTAWRLTIFALYLEIFNDNRISSDEVKKYITQKIKSGNIKIFEDFSKNIINGNSLEIKDEKLHFKNKTFDYIIGNPPFLLVTKDNEEIEFFNEYKVSVNSKEYTAKRIIGKNQISQAFMLKIKDWANDETNFGFVLNSSNFYNEGKSINFQNFFFENYQIKNFYELSRVKKILFKKATESVVVAIFNNKQVDDNLINYYPVDLELFSETFKLLVIKEDTRIEIKQSELLNNNISLRELLVGNEFDLQIQNKLLTYYKLDNFLLRKKKYGFRGLERIQNDVLREYFNINEIDFKKLPRKKITEFQEQFAIEKYLHAEKDAFYNTPYIYSAKNINSFSIVGIDGYINETDVNRSNFRRVQNKEVYSGNKIVLNRFGNKINALYINYDCYLSTYFYILKLHNEDYYLLFTAILNSDLVDYFLTQRYRMRVDGNFTNLDTKAIKNIPIPSKFDDDLFNEISKLSQQLTDGELNYENETKYKLNELIYDLYDLSYLERQRIKDFFAPKRIIKPNDLEKYKETLLYTLEMYFDNIPKIEYSIDLKFGFNMLVVGIFFNKKDEMPTSEKVLRFKINELMQKANSSLFAMREFLFGKNCIYIIKDRQLKNWTETKAYEDGKLILKNLS